MPKLFTESECVAIVQASSRPRVHPNQSPLSGLKLDGCQVLLASLPSDLPESFFEPSTSPAPVTGEAVSLAAPASPGRLRRTLPKYAVVANAGTDTEFIYAEFHLACDAYAFAAQHYGLDVMKFTASGGLTTEF